MADIRIDQLVAATDVNDEDFLILEQNGRAKKVTGSTLSNFVYDVAAARISEVEQTVADLDDAVEDLDIETDATLTVQNAPADAKATGDKIEDVESNFSDLKEALRLYLLELLYDSAYTDPEVIQYYNGLAAALGEMPLSSISAVFNPGNNVIHAYDELDSLKEYLIVTVNYTDNTTRVLQSEFYTLSGALVVGTSTITVSYHGQTTTFDANVVA